MGGHDPDELLRPDVGVGKAHAHAQIVQQRELVRVEVVPTDRQGHHRTEARVTEQLGVELVSAKAVVVPARMGDPGWQLDQGSSSSP